MSFLLTIYFIRLVFTKGDPFFVYLFFWFLCIEYVDCNMQNGDLRSVKELSFMFFNEEVCILFLLREEVVTLLGACAVCGGKLARHGKICKCTSKYCRKSVSLFAGSFFHGSRLPCSDVLFLAYQWLTKCSTETMCTHSGCSSRTVVAYRMYFRQLVCEMLESDCEVIGGVGVIVEVDETKVGKRKNHRGHRVEGAWVLVGVERTSERRVFAEVVANRDAATIESVLARHVAEGSILYTDEWKAYPVAARNLGLEHRTVKHKAFFKDPVTGVHTNSVEGVNGAIKRAIPQTNRTARAIPSLLVEYVWRRRNFRNLWRAFLRALKEVDYLGFDPLEVPDGFVEGSMEEGSSISL